MATTAPRARSSTRSDDRLFGLLVGAVALALIGSVWAWSMLSHEPSNARPQPVWMGLSRVISQLSDGRMLKVRVDLQLQNKDAVSALSSHQDILKSMVEEVSAEMSHDELQGPEGMRMLASHMRATFNDYLADQQIPHRVKNVMFEEWTLMP